mgnify:FL=1
MLVERVELQTSLLVADVLVTGDLLYTVSSQVSFNNPG